MSSRGSARTRTGTLRGTEAVPVLVEVDISPGLPCFLIVGLGDAAVLEARERVRSALRATGFTFPAARVVVNLAPAPLRKHGTGFDLAIAVGILVATGQLDRSICRRTHFVGELSLTGSIRGVPGILAHAVTAARSGDELVGPSLQAAGVVPDLTFRAVTHLDDLSSSPATASSGTPSLPSPPTSDDLADVAGQQTAKRVLEIAAVGGHNLLFTGPPGSGKTMLARRLGPLLPDLDDTERLESALVHSVSGLDETRALCGIRPFRAPHHSCTVAGLIGGGTPPRPGEASLAHTGVLFLDELPEFGPSCLQALRQPLEDGRVILVRAEGRLAFPTRFALVAAANPCPCGFFGDPDRTCTCSAATITRYASRVGGPLMDRIDMSVDVMRIDPSLLIRMPASESTATVRQRVLAARDRAGSRKRGSNASLSGQDLIEACRLASTAAEYLAGQAHSLHLSGRGITRLLRVARTIADIDGVEGVGVDHLAEAVGYRQKG